MAYKLEVDGLTEFAEQLGQMADRAPAIASQALYQGAGIMADALREGVKTIKTEKFHYAVFPEVTNRLPTPEEKAIIEAAAAGIAKFKKSGGEIDTSVGFRNAGYAELKGKMVPIPKIVNAINSGTSFMKKQPFVRKSANTATPKVLAAMQKYIEAEFEAIGKEYKASMK
jgi:hypothetical protein